MLRFVEIKVAKEEFYGGKKPIKSCDVDDNSIVISTLFGTKNNSKYLTEYLDKVIRSLVSIFSKMSGYSKRWR